MAQKYEFTVEISDNSQYILRYKDEDNKEKIEVEDSILNLLGSIAAVMTGGISSSPNKKTKLRDLW